MSERAPEYYDKLAGRYTELYGSEQTRKHEKILEIIGARRFTVFLDVGCGDGRLLSKAREVSEVTVGLDYSRNMLAKAKLILGENAALISGDALHLPLRSDSVDCVVSVSTATNESSTPIMAEAKRVARSGAPILISVLHSQLPFSTLHPNEKTSEQQVENHLLSGHETLYYLTKTLQQ